ncbi:hypothetical protein Q3G72_006844 [Acer saccharum]|nr:hypothetical protein Q3G72_006844 [Acer saccharum]
MHDTDKPGVKRHGSFQSSFDLIPHEGQGTHRSFVEVVKGNVVGTNEKDVARKVPGLSMFWKKKFSTEEDCMSDRWSSKGKLAWIDVFGIPMSCWEDSFFLKLGSLFGETLWIDKDSSSRKMLDKGRFLALIPLDWPRKFNIRVLVEGRSHLVGMEIDPKPIASSWLAQFLDIQDTLPKLGLYNDNSKIRNSSLDS